MSSSPAKSDECEVQAEYCKVKIPMTPEITVLMPVFNGEKFIRESIASILNQTFPDFEFLIINDGSTDHSLAIIEEYARCDARIRIISRENKGLAATLNEGIDLARGDYIARMDCDDISYPRRLERQLQYMRAHPDCVLCGSLAYGMAENGEKLGIVSLHVVPPWAIWSTCIFDSPFVHPSVVSLMRLRSAPMISITIRTLMSDRTLSYGVEPF